MWWIHFQCSIGFWLALGRRLSLVFVSQPVTVLRQSCRPRRTERESGFFGRGRLTSNGAQSYCKGCNRCSTLRLSRLQLRCGFHVRCQIKDVSNYAKRQILYPGGSSNSSNSRMLLSILTEPFPHKINNSLPMFWADSPLSYPTVCTYVPEL